MARARPLRAPIVGRRQLLLPVGGALDDEDLIALVGRELVGFRLTELLGAGGMAAVFRGENVLDPSIVRALKVVRPELAARPGFAKRFAREAGILESLQHPNVVRFHGVRTSADGWLVMELELLRGRTLSAIEGRVPVAQALTWIADAADGIAAVHALGVVHRDVKPSNLFLTDEGTVKVLDFGIARALAEGPWSTQLTAVGVVPGTPLYLAPEALAGRELTTAADVFALGVVLYELLAGHHPLAPPGSPPRSPEELYRARLREPTLPPLEDVPAVVRGLLDGALAEKPEARFRDAAAFATAVRATRGAVEGATSSPTAVAVPSQGPRRSSAADHLTIHAGGVAPTEVLAEAPPRLPGPVAATVETAPPSVQAARPEGHVWLKPALGREAVIVSLAGLGLGVLMLTLLAGWCREETPATRTGTSDVDASIASDAASDASDAASDVALAATPAVGSGRRERQGVVTPSPASGGDRRGPSPVPPPPSSMRAEAGPLRTGAPDSDASTASPPSEGTLDEEAARPALRGGARCVGNHYSAYLTRTRDRRRYTLHVSLRVLPSGSVSDVNVEGAPNEDMRRRAIECFRRIRMPPPEGGSVQISVPIVLSPPPDM